MKFDVSETRKKTIRQATLASCFGVLLLAVLIVCAFSFDLFANFAEKTANKDFRTWFRFSEETRYQTAEELPQAPYTVEAWLYFDSSLVPGGTWVGNLWSNYQKDGEDFLTIDFLNFYRPRVMHGSNGVWQVFVAEDRYPTDRWFLFAVVIDPVEKTVSFACDGEIKQTFSFLEGAEAAFGNLSFAVGQTAQPSSSSSYFRGYLAELAVYNQPLSVETLRKHQSAVPTAEEGLLARWKFIHGETPGGMAESDPLFCDLTGNGNDLQKETVWFSGELPEDGYTLAILGNLQGNIPAYDAIGYRIAPNRLLFLGDIVENSSQENWSAAYCESFREEICGQVPYSVCLGERDGTLYESSEFLYPEFLVFASQASGECCPICPADRWVIDESNGVSYLLLTLRVNPTAEEVAWANAVIEEHPNCNIILATHSYLQADGSRSAATMEKSNDGKTTSAWAGLSGEELWQELVSKHENILAVLSSHESYPGVIVKEDIGVHGNRVYQILCGSAVSDYYSGLIRSTVLLYFTQDSLSVRFYSPEMNAFYKEENQMDLPISLKGSYQAENKVLPTAPRYAMLAVGSGLLIFAALWCGWYQLLKSRERE